MFLIPVVLHQAVSPETNVIEVADDRPKRDYVYIDDFVDLLLRARSATAERIMLDLGHRSVSDHGRTCESSLPKPKPLVSRAQERRAEVMDVVADVSKARAELGWLPRTGLVDGLRLTLADMQASLTQGG